LSTQAQNQQLADPDPYTIANCYIAGAALVLQLVSIWQASKAKSASKISITLNSGSPHDNLRSQRLSQIENEVETLKRNLEAVTRSIERGLPNSEASFYSAPFRIGASQMMMEANFHGQYTAELAKVYTRLGHMSIYLNSIAGNDPVFAAYLGKEIEVLAPGATEQLNCLIAEGGKIRTVLAESKRVLEALDATIKRLQGGN
jgi:hypothetical protein